MQFNTGSGFDQRSFPLKGAASSKDVKLRYHRPNTYRRDVSLATNHLIRHAPSLGLNLSNWNAHGIELPCAKLQHSIAVAFFTTSPWAFRLHYIGLQEMQSSEGIALYLSAIYFPENPSTNAVRSGVSAGSALSCPTPKSRRSCTEPPSSRRSSNSAVLVFCIAASNPETTSTSRWCGLCVGAPSGQSRFSGLKIRL